MTAASDQSPAAPRPRGKRGSYRAGFVFGSLNFSATVVIGFLSTIVTARIYGVDVIGEYALVWAPVAALWVLSTVKEQQALIKEITKLSPRHPRVTQLFSAVFTFSTGLTVTVAVLDAIVCWFVFPGPLDAAHLLAPALVSIAGYTLVTNTGWNIDSVLSSFVAGRQLFWVRLNESVSFIVLAVGLGLAWHSVWGLVIAMIGASSSALVHRIVVVRPFLRSRLTREEYRQGMRVLPDLLRFGLRAAPGQIAQGISQQGGVWAIGMVAPVAVVGAYSRALVIPRSVQQASMRITEVLYPTLVGRHSDGDRHGFDRALIDSIRYEVIGMLALAAALGGAARSVLNIFGPGFAAAAPALALLALFPAMASVTVAQTQALWAVDKPGLTSLIAFVRLLLTVVLLVWLTPSLGVVGPAIAMLAGYAVVLALSGLALRPFLARRLRHTWSLRERLAVALAYAAGFAAAHATEQLVPTVSGMPLCMAAGAAAFVPVFLLCGGFNDRDRDRLAALRARFRARRQAEAGDPAALGPFTPFRSVPSSAAAGGSRGSVKAALAGTSLRRSPRALGRVRFRSASDPGRRRRRWRRGW